MNSSSRSPSPAVRQTLQVGRGCLGRCQQCGGLHFRFGNLSAHLDAESFLRLANRVQYAATVLGPKLAGDEHAVVPFAAGPISLLLSREDLSDLHRMVQDGLGWLNDGGEAAADLFVN